MPQPVNLDAAAERLTARADSAEGFSSVVTGREIYVPLSDLRTVLSALSSSNARPSKPCEECKGTGNKHCRPIAAGDLTKYDLCTECEGTGRVSSPRFCARAVAAEEALREIAETVQISRIRHIARTTLASMKGEE